MTTPPTTSENRPEASDTVDRNVHEAALRRLRDLDTIAEIGLKLASEIELDSLLQLIGFYGAILLEAERCLLYLLRAEDRSFELVHAHGLAQDPDKTQPNLGPNGSWHTRRIAEDKVCLHSAEGDLVRFVCIDPKEHLTHPLCSLSILPSSSGSAQTGAILGTIVGKQGVVGAMVVEEKVSEEVFDRHDGEVLERLLSSAGIAIENAEILSSLDTLVKLRTKELEAERDRNEALLHNVLPKETVIELQKYGRVAPRRFDDATILFTDFCGFTSASEALEPEELLAKLNIYYQEFDRIVERHNLERLKTIGDAYMAVAGVPVTSQDHAERATIAALEMADFVRKHGGEDGWKVRIGLHSGPVVAGVVGQRRFAFDIWGDAVNIASRMESRGIVGEVNVSRAFAQKITGRFALDSQGEIDIKGKGAMEMFVVSGPLPAPNDENAPTLRDIQSRAHPSAYDAAEADKKHRDDTSS